MCTHWCAHHEYYIYPRRFLVCRKTPSDTQKSTHLWSTSFCSSLQISSNFCCNRFLRCSGGRWAKSSVTVGCKSSHTKGVLTLNFTVTTRGNKQTTEEQEEHNTCGLSSAHCTNISRTPSDVSVRLLNEQPARVQQRAGPKTPTRARLWECATSYSW